MSIQNIDFGSGAENDGEFIATAFQKIQANFEDLYSGAGGFTYLQGAAGDGITDDTEAIQDAIDAASAAGGGAILVPQGTYGITETVFVKSNVRLVGNGKPVIKAIGDIEGAMVQFGFTTDDIGQPDTDLCRNASIEGIEIDGDHRVTSRNWSIGIDSALVYVWRNCPYNRVIGCDIHSADCDLFGSEDGSDFLIVRDNIIHDLLSKSSATQFCSLANVDSPMNVIFENNYLYDWNHEGYSIVGGYGGPLRLHATDNAVVRGNRMVGGYSGILVDGRSNLIENNRITGSTARGIYLYENTFYCRYNSVIGNYIDANGSIGIAESTGNTELNYVAHNTIANSTTGVSLKNGGRSVSHSNIIYDTNSVLQTRTNTLQGLVNTYGSFRSIETADAGYVDFDYAAGGFANIITSGPTNAVSRLDYLLSASGTASATVFRNTNTTGICNFVVYRGDNSSTANALLAGKGQDSFVCADNGNFGIGTSTPTEKLGVAGNATVSGTITVGNTGLVVGTSTPFSDSSGTLTLQNVDALDATTEATIEAAIDTLANLTSIQGVSFTFGAYAATLLNNANEAAFKAAVNLEAGVDFYSLSALASTANGNGSALIGIADAGSYFSGTTVESALQYLGGMVAALDQAVILKGTWDASSGSFPGAGAAQAGWSYIVSTGGTVNSVTFTAGDRIIAITDNASTSTFSGNWFKADYTDQVSSVDGQTGAVSLSSTYQPLDSDLTSWAGVTRAAGFDTFAATPSSANLASLVTGETGSGALVFGTSPALTTPTISGAMSFSGGTALTGGSGYLSLTGGRLRCMATNTYTAFNQVDSGTNGAQMDVDPVPADGTSVALFRFFRSTNTSGNVSFDICRGNNSVNTNCRLGGNIDSWLNGVLGNLGVGLTSTPGAKLHVAQASTTAAIPVLLLDQADDSEDMIEFKGVIGTGNAIEAVGAKTLTTTHFIKCTITGVGNVYIPVGTIA